MDVQVKPYRVLVCDDQADVLEALRLLLKGQGWQAVAVDSPDAADAQDPVAGSST